MNTTKAYESNRRIVERHVSKLTYGKNILAKLDKEIEDNIDKDLGDFTKSQLEWLHGLGVNVSELVFVDNSARKTAQVIRNKSLFWKITGYSVLIVIAGFLIIPPIYTASLTPYQRCQQEHGSKAATVCKEDGTTYSEFEIEAQKKEAACKAKGDQYEWWGIACGRVKYNSKQECIDAGEQGGKSHDDGTVVVTTCNNYGTMSNKVYSDPYDAWAAENKTNCKDVTSYDYNWNNDMLCTRPDGTQFYTSYNDAQSY